MVGAFVEVAEDLKQIYFVAYDLFRITNFLIAFFVDLTPFDGDIVGLSVILGRFVDLL